MAVPGQVSPDPHLPEQRLLRAGDRLQEYAAAFLGGEITAYEYGDLVMAEINRRSAIDPLPPVAGRDSSLDLARAFVDGGIGSTDFLRLIRDC